ncbi:DNA replication factor Cdt1 [Mastacembelus armatus]|uniref:Chromatin licensing and DNA replication factor 1 n=1 Tax=Mastacembelus armatus TaxID=205130 RepID=A0A3Q3LV96_9TELE|nr:DNA replication factor Cdt1 [Mastacembelus armatus]
MSQARVTDFFSQRKKGIVGPVKPATQRSRATTTQESSKHGDAFICSSSVHEEFVRVIDEAAGLNDAQAANSSTVKELPSSPRTPKRTSAEAQFDLSAAVFSATADHSTAKKRRQAEATVSKVPAKAARRTARKKLVLSKDTSQSTAQSLPSELPQLPPVRVGQDAETQAEVLSRKTGAQASQALCKEDITALKSRLQRMKKHAEEITSPALPASVCPVPNKAIPHIPRSTTHPAFDAKNLKLTVARAKELAARAQRRNEDSEAEESKQSEIPTHNSTEQPGYERYHTLAQAAPPGLSLPYQYKVLAEMFRSMDVVVAMLYNRCETVTFAKIRQGVQDMMHKRFDESHVGQIKTVFPEAYTFRQEKNIPTFNSSIKKSSYQLTVEPIILSDQKNTRPVMSASHLLDRRHVFHLNLVSIVKQHHKVFLSSLVPPVSVPEDKLTRWHPHFNVDTVPAVQTSVLPQPPHMDKLATAQEVLDKARSLITPKMEKALVSLVLKTEDKATKSKGLTPPQSPSLPQTPAPSVKVPAALQGVSQSLLERIRAKEAQKVQAAMTRNPKQEERLLMMSRLGELARILRNVFVAEKKPALIIEVACNRMVASYRSALSTGEMEKHIRLLAEVAADWLTIHPVRKDFYLKLNKNMELNVVLDKLSSRLREEERL